MPEKRRYTLEELSEMTALTGRTLRNYIRRGLLEGEKEKGKWYFTEEALETFFSSEFVRQGIKIKHQAVAGDFLHGSFQAALPGCFLYELSGEQERLMQLCQKVTEHLDLEGRQGRFSFYYDEKRKRGSFALVGDLTLIGQVVEQLRAEETEGRGENKWKK